MITLTTGTPGSGKSLYSIDYIRQKVESENKALQEAGKPPREVYYSGIAELNLPWIEMEDAAKWDELPVGSIIVIDECQRHFRPRGTGTNVPAYVSAMETHRHKGYDIFLITQHPMLLDQNIRRLVGQHFHLVRKFGLQRATVHEWGSCHEITQRNLLTAVRRQYSYSKEVFALYKSAELHTHKRRLPKRVIFLAFTPLIIIGLAYGAYVATRQTQQKLDIQQAATNTPAKSSSSSSRTEHLSKADYIQQYEPRLNGMAWTAPAYDEITKPVEAPTPTACIVNHQKDTCRCIDQQGNALVTTDAFCRQYVSNGMFIAWKKAPEPSPMADQRKPESSGHAKLPAVASET